MYFHEHCRPAPLRINHFGTEFLARGDVQPLEEVRDIPRELTRAEARTNTARFKHSAVGRFHRPQLSDLISALRKTLCSSSDQLC